jgi:hypothetical protein
VLLKHEKHARNVYTGNELRRSLSGLTKQATALRALHCLYAVTSLLSFTVVWILQQSKAANKCLSFGISNTAFTTISPQMFAAFAQCRRFSPH